MKYTYKGALSSVPKILTAMLLSVFLVACGGGTSGDGTDSGTLDSGELDGGDFGLDGGDDSGDFGLDAGGLDEGGTDDGFVSGGDDVDSDQDGISDADELLACQNQGGSDEFSQNENWNDNCTIRVDLRGGGGTSPFFNSTYANGIQRVLYCSGVAGVATRIAFVDGLFGPGTAEAVRAFQAAENAEVTANQSAGIVDAREILVVDGIVGPKTWSRLQTRVEENSVFLGNEDNAGNNYDVFGVRAPYDSASAVDCTNERNFLGRVSADTELIDSWRLTDTQGGTGVISFSTDRN